MEITIQHHEDLHFSAHHAEHQVVIDLPESHGGTNRGMTLKLPSGPLATEHEQGLHHSMENCLLYNTLAHQPDIDIEILALNHGRLREQSDIENRIATSLIHISKQFHHLKNSVEE